MSLLSNWRNGLLPDRSLSVLQVSTADLGGGAEKVAWELHQAYRRLGNRSRLAVGYKLSDDPEVAQILNKQDRSKYACVLLKAVLHLQGLNNRVRGTWRLSRILEWAAEPRRNWDIHRGIENFHYPGTWQLLGIFPGKPDIVHCHNLHGGYFDLNFLPTLSRQVPVVLTLHDAWLLSGHCAHSLGCERWKTGCGRCPDLSLYPSIKRDATQYNWRRKQAIYAHSHLYVAAPSRWLMQKVEHSMLAAGIEESRVIPYGIDLAIFHPASKKVVRAMLGIPEDTKVLLFSANGIRRNIWKDYDTLRSAVVIVSERLQENRFLFLALGEDAPAEYIGHAEIRFVPFQKDREAVARYYQAADIYVHAARADTFPNVVLEALACGTPVIATAVGGIPEQIDDGKTGFLTRPSDAQSMAEHIVRLLKDDDLRQEMGANAAEAARRRFDLDRQANEYLTWYQELLTRRYEERLHAK